MEKRLFLAVALSFLVIVAWSTIFPSQPTRKNPLNESQIFENKELISSQPARQENHLSKSIAENPIEIADSPINDESAVEVVESENLYVEIDTIGATISKIRLKHFDFELPIKNITSVQGFENKNFKVQKLSDFEIHFIFEDPSIKIEKIYILSESGFDIKMNTTVTNKLTESRLDNYNITALSLDMSNLALKKGDMLEQRDLPLNEYVTNTSSGIKRKNKATKFSDKDRREENSVVNWVGFRNRYFCFIFGPSFTTKGLKVEPTGENSLDIILDTGSIDFQQNQGVNFNATIYAGPEQLDLLKPYDLGFEKIRRYYKWSLFDAVAKSIQWVLYVIHKIVKNWGLAILILSAVIYFSMYPLNRGAMASMRKMQELQPRLAELKEKYSSNPQKLNQEMMILYKVNGVNPLGGCLPIFFQMPVFIGLYQVLWRSVQLKGASFLWMKDLSLPDRLFKLPFMLPVVGSEYFNLLPVLMIILMAIQQRLMSKNVVVTDPMQKQQQKLMGILMPIMIGFIFYKMPSGLSIYFTMFYLYSIFTQSKVSQEKRSV